MRPSAIRRCVRFLLGLAVVIAAACEREETIVFETVDLAEGEFSGLQWGGTQEERFYVVARKGPTNNGDSDAVLVSPQHEKPCNLGAVARYYAQQPQSGAKFVLGSPSPTRVVLFDNVEEGFGRMGFADVTCTRTDIELEHIDVRDPLRFYMPDLSSVLLGVINRDSEIMLVDPWKDEVTKVTTAAALAAIVRDGAWFIESGQAVKRDFTGRELRRRGTAVSRLWIISNTGNDIGYVDEGRLLVERAGKTEMLSSDGCELRSLGEFLPGALAFSSPCESDRLVVATLPGKQHRYENAGRYTARRGQLIVWRESEDGLTVFTAFGSAPDQLVKWFDVPGATNLYDITPVAGSWLVRVQRGEREDLLRLADRVPAEPPSTVAADMQNFRVGRRGGTLGWLLSNGDLTFTDANASGIYHRARGVHSFTILFERRAQGLTYITHFDEETRLGRLNLRLVSGESFLIAEDVREYREVWWPERGILYAQGGDNPGIRFARIDLPCEMTSDSPWACGF